MVDRFNDFLENNALVQPGERTLIAVSGGKDSVTLCELFARSGRKFGIAHCNFGLRGKDSMADEEFVEQLAKHYYVPFYCHRFRTKLYAGNNKISIQMAARELRYNWFREIAKKENYDLIATAHHLDDQVETFFINLLRSSGIAGLHGILPRQGNLIRPLLFLWREDIDRFIEDNHLNYREDRSNEETKYLRNRIRHKLIPAISEINPDFRTIITENIDRIRDAETIYREVIEKKKKEVFFDSGEGISISLPLLKEATPLKTYIFEFLVPFGFTSSQVDDIARAVDELPGAVFYSASWRLIRDRDRFILTPLKAASGKKEKPAEYRIKKNVTRIKEPLDLHFAKKTINSRFRIHPEKEYACLDFDKLDFPLILRKWKPGDSFYPFGKYIRKKVSDFFINEKLSLPEKENAWLLISGNRVAWVIGYRIDHRFRITGRTRSVLVIRAGK